MTVATVFFLSNKCNLGKHKKLISIKSLTESKLFNSALFKRDNI